MYKNWHIKKKEREYNIWKDNYDNITYHLEYVKPQIQEEVSTQAE